MKNEYAQWRKLDNAALAFPAVTGKNDTRVFRFYCELKEEIKEETLQKALDRTMEKYPLFRAVLRKGLFWFYLERRDIPAVVKEEAGAPCSGLYIPDKKTLLFRVSYYKNRIIFRRHIRRKNFRSFFQTKISPEEIWKRTVFPSIIPQMRQERESPRSRLFS